MKEEITKTIIMLTKRIESTDEAVAVMQLSQAVLNLTNALAQINLNVGSNK